MISFPGRVVFGSVIALAVTLIGAGSCGCSEGAAGVPPIISSPPDPWEIEVERGMLRMDAITPTPTPLVETWEAPDAAPRSDDHGALQTALADIIGFPFRAVAWLAHVFF